MPTKAQRRRNRAQKFSNNDMYKDKEYVNRLLRKITNNDKSAMKYLSMHIQFILTGTSDKYDDFYDCDIDINKKYMQKYQTTENVISHKFLKEMTSYFRKRCIDNYIGLHKCIIELKKEFPEREINVVYC